MGRNLVTWTVLSCLSLTAQAWIAQNRSPVVFSRQQHGSALKAAIDPSEGVNRRNIMKSLVAATGFTATISIAQAEDDPLDAFGKELSTAKWPQSPSPLPTTAKSAAELTAPKAPTSKDSKSKSATEPSDLEKALQNSSKQKQVGPLTHG
mmetsp:Transcript_1572/g.2157  ORF Transcript_1572/g.2157 Transcript_1572/m.2157 type:complete len:150 (+) Transcript_1572:109-558(+)